MALRSYVSIAATAFLLGAAPPALAAGPANDDFADAILLTGANGTITGANVGAGKQAGEPAHGGIAGGASVWYRWVAPESGHTRFDTLGSSFDTVLAVYTAADPAAPSVSSLEAVAANDDSGASSQSALSFETEGGTAYYVAVDSFFGAPKVGAVKLSWGPAPANDNFSDAEAISGSSGSTSGSPDGATLEAGEPIITSEVEPGTSFGSVWYTWSAPADAGTKTASFVAEDEEGFATVVVYTGGDFSTLRSVLGRAASEQQNAVNFKVAGGAQYRIALSGFGDFTLRWRVGLPPENDDFAAAHELVGDSGEEQGTAEFATLEADEPDHIDFPSVGSVWYRWTPGVSGTAVFEPTAGFALFVPYTGDTLAALDPVPASVFPSASFSVVAGEEYRLAALDFFGTETPFTFKWSVGPPPANDKFSNAEVLKGGYGQRTGSLERATLDSGGDEFFGAGPSVWYRWTAPVDGQATIRVRRSTFNALVGVFTGDDPNNLEFVADSFDSEGGIVSFPAARGTEYRVSVETEPFNGLPSAFVLSWRLPIVGTRGPNLIEGTPENDLIFGGAGNDRIDGNGGNDRIIGGEGDDRLIGGRGRDYVRGGAGNDRLLLRDGRRDRGRGGGGFDSARIDRRLDRLVGVERVG